MNNNFIKANLGRIYNRKNYRFSYIPYHLNIFGIRLETNTDKFDDIIGVAWTDKNQKVHIELFDGATDPGLKFLKSPINSKGTAILVPGQYINLWIKGPHGKTKYSALRQNTPAKVYRDDNKDLIHTLDPNTIQEGVFWINLHRAEKWTLRSEIGPYSAGCQVLQSYTDFVRLMKLRDKAITENQNAFTYTLFEKEDFEKHGVNY